MSQPSVNGLTLAFVPVVAAYQTDIMVIVFVVSTTAVVNEAVRGSIYSTIFTPYWFCAASQMIQT